MGRAACAFAVVCAAGGAAADGAPAPLVAAWLEAPTGVYGHRVLGDIPEAFVLAARGADGAEYRFDLRDAPGDAAVFEDVAPRVVDADGDGAPDIVVVESDLSAGAQLAVYGLRRGALAKVAATPHIGTRFRWLAPVAVADLNGDGVTDLAYVDRPHLAKTLRVWSWAPGGLTEIASMGGVTNHRIGDPFISGGMRDCGAGPELVLADGDWRDIMAVRFDGGALAAHQIGPLDGPADFDAALACAR
ncbi:FG-GAP repeat domain-containing protein [Meridianimarinicoccus sp. RP-17]|uniref:FG-GAP repeat domain-containing protein n=1 Tax=Meridianimarinicoccus zhengii TaxID=2056810 RepID=UPI000DAC51AB|nr:VCBS repeat-containing protein [Phycocomes zhengii]